MKALNKMKFFTPVLMFFLLSQARLNAQYYYYSTCTCTSGNPPGYCYTDKNGNVKCHKYHSNNGNDGGGGACICAVNEKRVSSEEFSKSAETPDGVFPNPVSNSTVIHITVFERQEVSLKVFDLTGKVITTFTDHRFEPGEYTFRWDAANLLSGIYILRLQTSSVVQTRKLLVIR